MFCEWSGAICWCIYVLCWIFEIIAVFLQIFVLFLSFWVTEACACTYRRASDLFRGVRLSLLRAPLPYLYRGMRLYTRAYTFAEETCVSAAVTCAPAPCHAPLWPRKALRWLVSRPDWLEPSNFRPETCIKHLNNVPEHENDWNTHSIDKMAWDS